MAAEEQLGFLHLRPRFEALEVEADRTSTKGPIRQARCGLLDPCELPPAPASSNVGLRDQAELAPLSRAEFQEVMQTQMASIYELMSDLVKPIRADLAEIAGRLSAKEAEFGPGVTSMKPQSSLIPTTNPPLPDGSLKPSAALVLLPSALPGSVPAKDADNALQSLSAAKVDASGQWFSKDVMDFSEFASTENSAYELDPKNGVSTDSELDLKNEQSPDPNKGLKSELDDGLQPKPHIGLRPRSESKESEFKWHPELLAFLQAKNWDSDFAHDPTKAVSTKGMKNNTVWKKFKSIVNSSKFDLSIGIIILANSIVMGLQLEYEGTLSAEKIGIKRDDGNWPEAEGAFEIMNHIFATIFLLELILRVAANGSKYFKDAVNLMDFGIVLASLLEYVVPMLGGVFPNLLFIRLLRCFKLVRSLRIIRVLNAFEDLRILVAVVKSSMKSFIWSMALLSTLIVISSIFMTQSLQTYLRDESVDPVEREKIYMFFGSWSRALITMFEITLALGTWGRCGRTVIFSVNRWYALFFLAYLAVVSFAVIRVLSALFIKDTMAAAAKDSDVQMMEVNKDPRSIKRIWKAFHKIDTDDDGALSLEEVHKLACDEKTSGWLKKIGLKPRELKGMFELMDDGDNSITFGEFLTTIMRLKNANKGVDLVTLLYENKKILTRVLEIGGEVKELREDLSHHKLASNLKASHCPANKAIPMELQRAEQSLPSNPRDIQYRQDELGHAPLLQQTKIAPIPPPPGQPVELS